MITLQNVSRSYGMGAGAVPAVRDVSLTIEPGSFVTVVGASGSGKSTLLHLMGALDQPTAGTVLIEGKDVGAMNDDERTLLRRTRIGFVFQFFNLLPTLTAVENVALPARLAGESSGKTRGRAQSLLERIGLGARGNHRPDELSGGEMQRVAIARALMMDPPVLLADEPTGNLDSATGNAILELLRGAVDAHRTVVLITHDPSIARRGNRVLTMGDGQLIGDEAGSPSVPPRSSP
ncbi:MAG TPA: ABC transporter ATP-binding protein [Polyangiaceae bacterium]|jgi:putative ABC transport system ATP-binding protein|nr:ABC transporter ATP-binding protein [Polyangiaceae bacterium]